MNKHILKHALIGAGVTTAWILIVVNAINYVSQTLQGRSQEDTILIPIVMLLLFVISAAITGMGVFGRPIMWYMDGKKKEAMKLVIFTLGFLVIVALFFVSILI